MPTTPLVVATLPNGLLYVTGGNIALGNYVQNLTAPHAQTQTNSGEACLMAVALPVLYTGVFRLDLACFFADDTTAKTVNLNLVLFSVTSPTTRFTAAGAGTGSTTGVILASSLSPQTAASWGLTLSSDCAGNKSNAIFFNGTAIETAFPGAYKIAARTVDTLTARDVQTITVQRISERRVSAEGQEGMKAFLEKRPPEWTEKPGSPEKT